MRRRRTTALAACLVAAATLTACSGTAGTAPDDPSSPPSSSSGSSTSSTSPSAPALVSTPVAVPDGMTDSPFDVPRTLMAPPGWSVAVWSRMDGPRLMAWTPDGRLLVSRPKDGSVRVLTPAPRGDGPPQDEVLLDGLEQPHGLAFEGSTLYVAESNRLDAYDYADGKASDRATVLDDLPDAKSPDLRGAYAHALKSVAVGKDGSLYVSVGSTGNVSAEDRDASPQRATVLRVPAGTRDVDAKDAQVFATGVRNGTGLAVAPDGEVWTAVNNRDNIAYPFHRAFDDTADGSGGDDYGNVVQGYVDDHPLEPLAHLTAGRDLGWPYCNPDPSVDPGVKGSALAYGNRPYVRDADSNPDGEKLDCAALPRIEQGLPAHSAPLGLSFATLPGYGAGAVVGSHGSWNRQPPQPPNVSFFPDANGTMGDRQEVLTGWQGEDGQRWGRTVAAVVGPDGALYVSDDAAGAIYRINMTPTG